MNKYLLLFLFSVATLSVRCQQSTFQGTYQNGGKTTESAAQYLKIHYEKTGGILFYIEVWRGAPSYNSGALYGRLVLNNQSGHLQYTPTDTAAGCSLEFIKTGNKITVKTISGNCPFGYGVYADGVYSLKSSTNPMFFKDRASQKIYFSKTPPEKYEW